MMLLANSMGPNTNKEASCNNVAAPMPVRPRTSSIAPMARNHFQVLRYRGVCAGVAISVIGLSPQATTDKTS